MIGKISSSIAGVCYNRHCQAVGVISAFFIAVALVCWKSPSIGNALISKISACRSYLAQKVNALFLSCFQPTSDREPNASRSRISSENGSASIEGESVANSVMPVEILQSVFRHLSNSDLAKARGICREWRDIIDGQLDTKCRARGVCFLGKNAWAHLGDVGEEPLLPENLMEILSRPCPKSLGLQRFGSTFGEAFMLLFVPAKLNGQPLNYSLFKSSIRQDLVVDKFPRARKGFEVLSGEKGCFTDKGYWMLLSKGFMGPPTPSSETEGWISWLEGWKSRSTSRPLQRRNFEESQEDLQRLGENQYRIPKWFEMLLALYLNELIYKENLYPATPDSSARSVTTNKIQFAVCKMINPDSAEIPGIDRIGVTGFGQRCFLIPGTPFMGTRVGVAVDLEAIR